MIEVGRSGAPRIVKITQLLFAEVTRGFVRKSDLCAQILIGQILEAHLSTAPGVQCNGPISFVAHRAVVTAVIEEGTDDIGIEENFYLVPIIGPQFAIRGRKRKLPGR